MKDFKMLAYPLTVLGLFFVLTAFALLMGKKVGKQSHRPREVNPILFNDLEASKVMVVFEEEGRWSWLQEGAANLSVSGLSDQEKQKASKLTTQDFVGKKQSFLFLASDASKEELLELMKILGPTGLERVYVTSPYHSSLSNLKRLESRFMYAASSKDLMKWRLFSVFYLEEAYTLNADFLFVTEKILSKMNPRLRAEIHRRKIPVIQVDEGLKTLSAVSLKQAL